MRNSKVLKKLRAGQVATCFKTNFSEPKIVEMAGLAGFDCIWTCYEHCPVDLGVVEGQVYAAKAVDMDIIVRISKGSYSDFIRPLEMDATGIMVPHLMSLKEAKEIVHNTRFHPVGRRPIDGGNSDGGFLYYGDTRSYIADSNREKLVICQIEDPEPMEEIEEIASIEGIDMLFFGPGDYSHALGVPGDFNDARVKAAWKKVAEVCIKHKKFAGTVATAGNLEELYQWGYTFLNMNSDVGLLHKGMSEMLRLFDRIR
ncbi:MAG: aldolase/citrate lyase family protein [Clostridia bacterium]